MKKILFLFALVATVVISAVSFVSCTSNDDSSVFDTYKFSVVLTTQSKDANVLKAVEITNTEMARAYAGTFSSDETSANLIWYEFINVTNDFKKNINELAKVTGDKTLVLTVSLLKNGSEVKKEVYTPLLLDF